MTTSAQAPRCPHEGGQSVDATVLARLLHNATDAAKSIQASFEWSARGSGPQLCGHVGSLAFQLDKCRSRDALDKAIVHRDCFAGRYCWTTTTPRLMDTFATLRTRLTCMTQSTESSLQPSRTIESRFAWPRESFRFAGSVYIKGTCLRIERRRKHLAQFKFNFASVRMSRRSRVEKQNAIVRRGMRNDAAHWEYGKASEPHR